MTVYGILYLIYFTRRVMLISYWCCLKDPRIKQAKINCLTFSILNSFECVWFIYGNTFFYTEVFTSEEKNAYLWRIMLAAIIYGYISMLVFLCSLCGLLAVLCVMRQQGYFDVKQIEQYHQQVKEKNTRSTIKLDSDYIQ